MRRLSLVRSSLRAYWDYLPRHRALASSLPGPDYPPANLASMIKQCEAKGRSDLGQLIMDQWNRVVVKYPQTRVNWGAATKIGAASIKKNVFGGVEFIHWIEDQVELSPKEKQVATKTRIDVRLAVPAIAIPKDNETPEQWSSEADKTKSLLDNAEQSFQDVAEFVAYLQEQVNDLQRKLKDYGQGGAKEMTKSGKPHAFTARLPKWQTQLDAYSEKLDEVKDAQKKFQKAKKAYDTVPVTTVEFEKKTQGSLEEVLTFILNVKDFQKQQELLNKFNDTLKRAEKQEAASLETAGLWDWLVGAWEGFMGKVESWWNGLMNWLDQLFGAVEKFEDFAYMDVENSPDIVMASTSRNLNLIGASLVTSDIYMLDKNANVKKVYKRLPYMDEGYVYVDEQGKLLNDWIMTGVDMKWPEGKDTSDKADKSKADKLLELREQVAEKYRKANGLA